MPPMHCKITLGLRYGMGAEIAPFRARARSRHIDVDFIKKKASFSHYAAADDYTLPRARRRYRRRSRDGSAATAAMAAHAAGRRPAQYRATRRLLAPPRQDYRREAPIYARQPHEAIFRCRRRFAGQRRQRLESSLDISAYAAFIRRY